MVMDVLYQVMAIDEKIEDLYIRLINLSINGVWDGADYQYFVAQIKSLVEQERDLLADQPIHYHSLKEELQKYMIPKLPINLEHHTNSFLIRLDGRLDAIYGDPGIEYANALYYDIHKIISKLLVFMIHNDYYAEIRDDLIRFYYDIIFLDDDMERDFCLQIESQDIELSSQKYQEDCPSFKYIDRAILFSDAEDDIQNIAALENRNNPSDQALIAIYIMEIYARIALSKGSLQEVLLDDFKSMLEDEVISSEVKNMIMEIGDIFRQVQNQFYFSR